MAEWDRLQKIESSYYEEISDCLHLFPRHPGLFGPERKIGQRYQGTIKRPDGSELDCEFQLHNWEFMAPVGAPPGSDYQLGVVLPGLKAEDVPDGSELWTSDEDCLLTIAWANE